MRSKRKAKSCEWQLSSGSVVCVYLSLAHLRLQTGVEYAKSWETKMGRSTAGVVDMRLHCQCRGCRRAETFSLGGLSTSIVELWLRNSARLRHEDTSITWRMELQPIGQERSSVSSVFGPDTVMAGTLRAELETVIGANTPGLSNTAGSRDQEKQPITS